MNACSNCEDVPFDIVFTVTDPNQLNPPEHLQIDILGALMAFRLGCVYQDLCIPTFVSGESSEAIVCAEIHSATTTSMWTFGLICRT